MKKKYWITITLITSLLFTQSLIGAPRPQDDGHSHDGHDHSAQTAIAEAEATVYKDIDQAREALATLHDKISGERVERVRKVDALLKEVKALEAELAKAREKESSLQVELEETQKETEYLDEVIAFIDDLTREYRRAFETRIHLAELQCYEDRLGKVDGILKSEDSLERLSAVPELLAMAESHLEAQSGGRIFQGKALDMDGQVHEGGFALAGPVAYFASPVQGPAGLVIQRLGSLNPTVYDPFGPGPQDRSAAIRDIVAGAEATVPVDITLGSAVKLQQAQETLIDHAKKGGITMIPLLALAGVCLLLALYKFVYLQMIQTRGSEKKVARVIAEIKEDRADSAQELARKLPRPLGPVISEGVKHRNAPKEHLEEILTERILAQVPSIERLLTPLAVCASAAPLLGLLGTVTGMIHTFKLITVFGTGDAGRLSSGISEALVTTEFGLIIAIPALLIHAYLSRRARKAVAHAQQTALMFVNSLKLS